jgi:hypothetical protein
MKIGTNLIVALTLTILFSGCESTPTPKKSVPISKDEHFANRCASIAINLQVHKSCSVRYSQLKPNVNTQQDCSLEENPYECRTWQRFANTHASQDGRHTATLRNEVFLSCGTPWGEVIDKAYECFYDNNGELDGIHEY